MWISSELPVIRAQSKEVSVLAVSSDSCGGGTMLIAFAVTRVRLVKNIFRGSRLNGFSAE
jgi:hypothetical protein